MAYDYEIQAYGISYSPSNSLVINIHRIDLILALENRCSGRLSEVPVLQCLVPRARGQHRCIRVGDFEESEGSDGGIVGSDLLRRRAACGEIDESSSFVGTCACDLLAVLLICD